MTGDAVSLVFLVFFCSSSRICGQGGNDSGNASNQQSVFQSYGYFGQDQPRSPYAAQYQQSLQELLGSVMANAPWNAPRDFIVDRPSPSFEQSPALTKAMAILSGTSGVRGMVVFTQLLQGGLNITGNISGLVQNSQHGFHVHQYGDLSNGCNSTGSHFNPTNSTHGSPDNQMHHAGDLGNIVADGSGTVALNIIDNSISLGGMNNVIGRGVVVHQLPDDLGLGGNADSLATGNAGGRIACGAIVIAI